MGWALGTEFGDTQSQCSHAGTNTAEELLMEQMGKNPQHSPGSQASTSQPWRATLRSKTPALQGLASLCFTGKIGSLINVHFLIAAGEPARPASEQLGRSPLSFAECEISASGS